MMGAVVSVVGVLALIFVGYGVISSAQNFGTAVNATYVPEAAVNAGMTGDATFSVFSIAMIVLALGTFLIVGIAIVVALT